MHQCTKQVWVRLNEWSRPGVQPVWQPVTAKPFLAESPSEVDILHDVTGNIRRFEAGGGPVGFIVRVVNHLLAMLGSVALYIFCDILTPDIEKSAQVSGIARSLPPQHGLKGSVPVLPAKLPEVCFNCQLGGPHAALPTGVVLGVLLTAPE